MGKWNHLINSFGAGEVSENFFGRTDSAQYNQACEKIENFVTHPVGGASRRPGSFFVLDITKENGGTPARPVMIPFSTTDGGRWQVILNEDTPTYVPYVSGEKVWKVINVGTGVVQALIHKSESDAFGEDYYTLPTTYFNFVTRGVGTAEIQWAQSGDTLVITFGGRMRPIRVIYDPDNNSTNGTDFYFHGIPRLFGDAQSTTVNEFAGGALSDPYLDQFEQFLDEPQYHIQVASSMVAFPADLDDTVGANSVLTFTGISIDSSWKGRVLKLNQVGTTSVVVAIFHVASSSVAYARIIGGDPAAAAGGFIYYSFDNGGSTSINSGAWDDTHGWPKSVCFFESRLVFGGSLTFPNRCWFSQTNDILQFMREVYAQDLPHTTVNTDPFQTTLIAGNGLNQIRWLAAGKTITAGTSDCELSISGPDASLGLGILNILTSVETENGSATTMPVRMDNAVTFLSKDRRKLRELIFNFNEDSFKADDMNILADNVAFKSQLLGEGGVASGTGTGFLKIRRVSSPWNILWAINNQGSLLGMTRDRFNQVAGWHRHRLGGESFVTSDYGDEAFSPGVLDISVITRPPLSAGYPEQDELWMLVARGIKQSDNSYLYRIFVERMGQFWDNTEIFADDWVAGTTPSGTYVPNFMDCAVAVTSSSFASGVITGLPFGKNAVVDVVCNGVYFGQFTADDSGHVDISAKMPEAPWAAIIGFNYLGELVPLTPEIPTSSGSSQGRPRRAHEMVIHFYRTIGAKFGRVSNMDEEDTPLHELEEIIFKRGETYSGPYPLYTGDKKVTFPQGYETRPKVRIQSHLPFPMTVTHIAVKMQVEE